MSPTESDRPGLGGTILVADDSHSFLSLYEEVLTRWGVTLHLARNGTEAIQETWRTRPDLIILDFEMPEISGAECARLLKQDPTLKAIPVLIITSHISPEDFEACRRSGADEILAKPFSEEQLYNLLKRHLSTHP